MSNEDVKKKAKELANQAGEFLDDKYDDGLEKITGSHKPSVARSRIFVVGVIVGVLLTSAVVWIF